MSILCIVHCINIQYAHNYCLSVCLSSAAQELNSELAMYSSQLDALLTEYSDLFQTPFDQSQFQSDIDSLHSQLSLCAKVRDEKEKGLKFISGRVRSMEKSWDEFEAWLQASEERVNSLSASVGVEGVKQEQNLKEAQVHVHVYMCNEKCIRMY